MQAENHYTADYPDEDDEFELEDGYGERRFGYRNGYGPDDDEYDLQHDEDDGYMLDDGDDDEFGIREARQHFQQYRPYD